MVKITLAQLSVENDDLEIYVGLLMTCNMGAFKTQMKIMNVTVSVYWQYGPEIG